MSIASSPVLPTTLPSEPSLRKFNVDEYHRMAEAGILYWGESVDLIEGVVREKNGAPRLFTVREYDRMLDVGILKEGDPIELISGQLRYKMTKGAPHDSTVDRLGENLRDLLPGWRIRIQSVIVTGDSEPEPDVAVAMGPADRYDRAHPRPHELAMVVEVADSSLAADRDAKLKMYAQAGIAIYWIVNIPGRVVEVYEDPTGPSESPTYRKQSTYQIGDSAPIVIQGKAACNIKVRDFLRP